MATYAEIKERREMVAQYLRRSIKSIALISKATGLSYKTVDNDIKFLRKNSRVWLTQLSIDGLVHDTQMGVEAMQELEKTLQNMLEDYKPKYNKDGTVKDKGSPLMVLQITREIRELIDTRLETLANGPTLMALRGGVRPKED